MQHDLRKGYSLIVSVQRKYFAQQFSEQMKATAGLSSTWKPVYCLVPLMSSIQICALDLVVWKGVKGREREREYGSHTLLSSAKV